MSGLVKFLSILVAIGVQITLWPELTNRVLPAVVLAMAVVWGHRESPATGFQLAFLGGLLLDLYAQHSFGLYTAATLAGYGTVWLVQRPSEDSGLGERLASFAVACLIYELMLVIIINFSGVFPFFDSLLKVSTLNIAVSLGLFVLMQPLITTAKAPPRHARPL